MRKSVEKRFDIEMLNRRVRTERAADRHQLSGKDVKVTRDEGEYLVEIKYEDREPYLSNLYIVAEVDESVEIRR